MQTLAILIDYENFACPPEGLQEFISDFTKRGTANWFAKTRHARDNVAQEKASKIADSDI